jgi:hypothetical protein
MAQNAMTSSTPRIRCSVFYNPPLRRSTLQSASPTGAVGVLAVYQHTIDSKRVVKATRYRYNRYLVQPVDCLWSGAVSNGTECSIIGAANLAPFIHDSDCLFVEPNIEQNQMDASKFDTHKSNASPRCTTFAMLSRCTFSTTITIPVTALKCVSEADN